MVASRARLANDPDKYIRPVKGGKFQARPYCGIAGRRYDLGLFATRHDARRAIQEFWWGKRPALLPGTRRFRRKDGSVWYAGVACVLGEWVCVRRQFDSREEAHAAVVAAVRREFGRWPLVCWVATVSLSDS